MSAIDNLEAILRDGMIRGASRLIRGKRPVVCLFDATTHELGALLVRSNRRRYEPFGLAIDKRYAFAMGARPVLYMPWREARVILAERRSGGAWRQSTSNETTDRLELRARMARGGRPAVA